MPGQKPDERPRASRMDAIKATGVKSPPMPPNRAPHITDWFVDIGVSEAAGMGAAPLSWREIDAWCDRTGVDLKPWESRLIRRLSADYLRESRKAESETCPAPWLGKVTKQQQAAEVAMLDAVLG